MSKKLWCKNIQYFISSQFGINGKKDILIGTLEIRNMQELGELPYLYHVFKRNISFSNLMVNIIGKMKYGEINSLNIEVVRF